MSSTTFVDQVTPVPASWLNDVNAVTYTGKFGTGVVLPSAVNPVLQSSNSVNGYTQNYIYNANSGISASADFAAYANNSTASSGFVDIGFTSSTYADTSFTVTGPNEAYLLGSAPAASGKTGNLVLATDSTGTTNAIQFYVGGFAQTKVSYKMQIDSTGVSAPSLITTTQAVTDNSTKAATTAFVKSLQNSFNAGSGFATNTTLTTADYGKFLYVSGTIVVTLPVADATNIGRAITLNCYTTGIITVATQSGQTLYYPGASTTTSAIMMGTGDCLNFINYSGSGWMAVGSNCVGIGQTWQNVMTTPGRVLGTTYTNSTGKPIQVSIVVTSIAGTTSIVNVGGVQVAQLQSNVGGATSYETAIFIVPNGATYAASAGGAALVSWAELR